MHRSIAGTISIFLLLAVSALAQEYIHPNKKLCDQGLLEHHRYTLEGVQANEGGGSFDPFTTLSWGPERRLTEQDFVFRSKVVTSGNSLFCTYMRLISEPVYFIRSLNSGNDWEPYIALGDSSGAYVQKYPDIVINGPNLLIGFMGYLPGGQGYNPGYYKSTDFGETWGPLNEIFPNYETHLTHFSSFCGYEETVYASYCSYERDSIYVIRSTDWGDSWNGRGVNVAHQGGLMQPMTVRASENTVHLIWYTDNITSVLYSRSTDRGLTWSDALNLEDDPIIAEMPFIAVQDSHVVACWTGRKYNSYGDMFIRQSFDSGETWEEEQVVVDSHWVQRTSIYIEDNLIVAAWEDCGYDYDNTEVVVSVSYDYGQSWSQEERLSYGTWASYAPIACRTGKLIHVFWGDIRPEAPGLYYCADNISTDVDEAEIPHPSNIYISSHPNPFNGKTMITYRGIEAGEIEIYDITGRLIKSITINSREGEVTWDATDNSGNSISSGIYFINNRRGGGNKTLRVTYLK